jgi:hypothetical protein
VILGRRVVANGAWVGRRVTAEPITDFGKDERLYFGPVGVEAENRRRVAAMALWVVYHLPLLWRRYAAW